MRYRSNASAAPCAAAGPTTSLPMCSVALLPTFSRARPNSRAAKRMAASRIPLEVEHIEIADPGCTKRLGIGLRALALQHQHRKAFALRQKIARERAERERARPRRRNALHLAQRQQFDEHAGELHDAVMRAP